MLQRFLIFVFTIITLSSCINADDIKIKKVQNIEVKGSGIQNILFDAYLLLENNSAHNITITDIEITLKQDSSEIAVVTLNQRFKIAKKDSNQEVKAPLKVTVKGNFLQALLTLKRVDSLSADLKIKGRSFIFSRTKEYNDMGVDKISQLTGINILELIK